MKRVCLACGKPMRSGRTHRGLGNFHGQACSAAYGERAASSVWARLLTSRVPPITTAREKRSAVAKNEQVGAE